jgi:hypothetical protein
MRYCILLAPLLLAAAALALRGQPPGKVPGVPPDMEIVVGVPGMPGVPGAPATANPADMATTAASAMGLLGSGHRCDRLRALVVLQARVSQAAAPPSPRLARLTQLQFDRRPSTVLKSWAHRPEAKPAGSKEPAKTPLDLELETFQKHVTQGNWPAVKAYLARLPAAEGKAAYRQMLQSLQVPPGGGQMPMAMGPMGPMPMQRPELNAFSAEDVIGLAAAAPHALDKELIASLGGILRRALDGHAVPPDAVTHLKAEANKGEGKGALTPRQAAQVLMAASEPVSAGAFLPGLDRAVADKDSEALNLLARHFLGVHASEKKPVFLERAWSATQAVLALGAAKTEEREEAVQRAVELAPKVKEELGQAWLEQSFTTYPERGMDILATVGSFASQGLVSKPMDPNERLKVLQLQKTAVDALLKAAPQRATQWRHTLALLAGVWMREAEYSQQMDRGVTRRRRDQFGNFYWMGDEDMQTMMLRQQNLPLPIATADLLRTRPDGGWVANLDAGPRAKLSAQLAYSFLRANDEKKAFPLIEELAPTNKEAARELVNEFLRVWTANHDPNTQRQNFNPYVSVYGFDRSMDSIPLTRSKQERNLLDLTAWVERMRRLPLERLDEDLLVEAFTKCHSSAEVYRLEAIEKVFGPLPKIKPRTLAALLQKTRENLASVWREPAEQEKKKTKRKQKDIQVEVLRGYELADKVVGDALKQFPEDWSLTLARAALLHDETNYRQEVAKSSDYSKKREEALAAFHRAADLYAGQVKRLSQDEESIAVYEQWFYASLGASDLAHVDEEKLPDPRQAALIRKAIQALPPEVAERHMDKMANSLVTNMSAVKPAGKHRYLKQGFDIIGDNKYGVEAKQVFDYYKDLITEVKLDVVIDGSDKVGHKQPFGVFVNLRHTREIERESNGFGRYLQNQNSVQYSFNGFGRPTADYRDRFQAAATEALKDQFEILSVTFQTDKVHSRATQEYGWRVTPYAYLLLRPRGPQIDKIPPLRMDLDFQETSGYVILPVESPAVPIDASSERGAARPVHKLQITQILDERQADKGKLGLEIKATGVGLVGALEDTLNLDPEGFEVARADDQGVSVAKYDEDADGIAVVSERTWLVELRARQDRAAAPTKFRFGTPRGEVAEMAYQRYQDADLATVEQEVALEHEYQGRGRAWLWVAGAGSAVLLGIVVLAVVMALRRRPRAAAGVQLPEKLTPFTVTLLLRRLRQTGGLSPADQGALDRAIEDLERRFFADVDGGGGEIDLRTLAEDWVRKAQNSPGRNGSVLASRETSHE